MQKQPEEPVNDKALAKELELLKALKAHLEDGNMASTYETEDEDELGWIAESQSADLPNR